MEVWQSPVYCYSLENCRTARYREFKSHRFRQILIKVENYMDILKKAITDKLLIFTVVVFILLLNFYSTKLLICAIVANWIIFNCVSMIVHEGWSHNYIIPKNNIVKCILNTVACLTHIPSKYSPFAIWKELHLSHHKFFKDPDYDYIQYDLNNNNWFTYIFTSNLRVKKNIIKDTNFDQYVDKLDSVDRWFNKHYNKVIVISHISLLLLLGASYYFYFVIFQIWLFGRQMPLIGEWLPHKHAKNKHDENDNSWLFFYYGSNAYHVSHHRYINEMNLGQGWLKYLNIQYYFIKLFYNVNSKCKIV
jgi:fatty acid desaturase